MSPEDDRRRVLADAAATLANEVSVLALSVVQLGRRTDRQQRHLNVTVLCLVLDVILTAAMGWAYHVQSGTLDLIESTRFDAVCPILATMLGGYDPNTRPAGSARQAYEDAYGNMRVVFNDILHCHTKLVPPRNDLVTTTPPRPK